jgi:hypothetical protein
MNLSLGNARLPAAFTNRRNLGPCMGQRKYLLRDQIVGQDYISGLEKTKSAEREQTGVAGACSG